MALSSRTGSPVYPRACGGTAFWGDEYTPMGGLSPRLRGNPSRVGAADSPSRSIPAPAGEPIQRINVSNHRRVYPRACGGTKLKKEGKRVKVGLSPRLRGNRHRADAGCHPDRSIPAPAGEPPYRQAALVSSSVYPRACGGTYLGLSGVMIDTGLSPRLRGNLPPRHVRRHHFRSIPAPAGEPTGWARWDLMPGVYPRACGGTEGRGRCLVAVAGLSPRLRGNRSWDPPRCRCPRSIPAPAGEPALTCTFRRRLGVYPRACGGTLSSRYRR